jgi:hypothetical protein
MQLPEHIIFPVPWSGQHKYWRWMPPPVSDFAGPDDLATLLSSFRRRAGEIEAEGGDIAESFCDLSDAALRGLFTVAYRASFLKEEGRLVTACLYAPPRQYEARGGSELAAGFASAIARWASQQRELQTNRFELTSPIPLNDPKHIARLSPTLAADDAVMVVGECSEGVECRAIALLDYAGAENDLLDMPRLWGGREGMFVRILGPGELIVSEGRREFALRANTIRLTRQAASEGPVFEWLNHLAETFVQQCADQEDSADRPVPGPDGGVVDLIVLWSRVLREATDQRHGGAFVVLPDGRHDDKVRAKYGVKEFDLGADLRWAWCSLRTVWRSLKTKGDSDLVDHLEAKRQAVHKLCSASRSIGQLSATDGCVILNRQLGLLGFGGEIDIKTVPDKKCYRVVGGTEVELSASELLMPFGQRHKSAFRLCAAVPHCMTFVVSQDGDLRLFSSTEDSVYLYDSLHA